jgi:hypothetical protein
MQYVAGAKSVLTTETNPQGRRFGKKEVTFIQGWCFGTGGGGGEGVRSYCLPPKNIFGNLGMQKCFYRDGKEG